MKLMGWKMRIGIVLIGYLLLLIPTLSFTQEFPTKPINITVVYVPGDVTDVTVRVLASKAEKLLGQPIVILNKPGGAGSVGLGIVAKEKPDGYHLVACVDMSLIRVPQFRKVDYKLEDFVPIMHYCNSATGVVVQSSSPWKTLKELIQYARENPGKVTYSTSGAGSGMHIGMVYVEKQEGIQWTHVPYPGAQPALAALLGGHVTAHSGSTAWVPHVREGKLRLLATHGGERMKAFPGVPTFRELGYDFINEATFMIAAPKGTPLTVVRKLDDAFRKAQDDPEFVQTIKNIEHEVSYRNHEDFEKYLKESYKNIGKLITDFKLPTQFEKK